MLDPDLIVHFEITPHRTVIFYLGIFGSIMATARGMIPEDNRIYEAEVLMEEVIQYTHYMPENWKGELHSKQASKLLFHTLRHLTSLGQPRIRRALCDACPHLCPGDFIRCLDTVRPLVLPPCLRTCHHRLFARFYCAR